MKDEYIRRATLVRVIDGDTIEVDVSMGLGVYFRTHVRLAGINAPEMVGESKQQGILAKNFLWGWLVNQNLTVKTEKPHDKYGRYLAWVFLENDEISINEKMILAGYAVRM